MSKRLIQLKGARRIAAFYSSVNQPGQRVGPDGRFLKATLAPDAVVVVETRQQRRYSARQAAKAGDVAQVAVAIWDDVTGGAGVVLVDGQPVKTTTQAGSDGGKSEALK